jgi:hypothetical protein
MYVGMTTLPMYLNYLLNFIYIHTYAFEVPGILKIPAGSNVKLKHPE